jgi:hypothetical protein
MDVSAYWRVAPGDTDRRMGVSAYRRVAPGDADRRMDVSRQSHRLPFFFLMRTNRPYTHTRICRSGTK